MQKLILIALSCEALLLLTGCAGDRKVEYALPEYEKERLQRAAAAQMFFRISGESLYPWRMRLMR